MDATRRNIYMDNAATTPVRPAVVEAMLPYFGEVYGNPSSIHSTGRQAAAALTQARRTIAATVGARPSEIIFTGCGSESDNAALRGIALARRERTGASRIVTSAVEHHAVLTTAEALRDHAGFALTVLPVDSDGLISLDDLDAALAGGDVAVVSIMLANNEIGTIMPLAEIGARCRSAGVPLHTDAVQAGGKLSLDVEALGVDALSAGAHKFYGPKGVGFLYLRGGTPFVPAQTGGGHEGGRRAGTENLALIVGMAAALSLAEAERLDEMARLRVLRDQLIGGILEGIEGARLTGHATQRLDNHASFLIEGVEAEGVLIALDMAGVAASSGSACNSAAQRPSHVLEAIGVPARAAASGLRLSLGRHTTPADVEYVLEKLPQIVGRLKA